MDDAPDHRTEAAAAPDAGEQADADGRPQRGAGGDEAQGDGRDHHIKGFSIWMAGGGIKPGISYGATDELGYNAVENKVHVHDFHATMLHLLGIDHKKLTYRFQGRDFRLTDVAGNVVEPILL